MQQLTINDIFDYVNKLAKEGMNFKDIMALPIYLGNDDELNGIHNGWCCKMIDSNDKSEDMQYLVEMINENYSNKKLNDKGILIS